MRPHIICHMMSSVNGRIIGDRWTPAFDGTDFDTTVQCYYDIRNDMDVDAQWLGRKTVQTDLVKASFDHRNDPLPVTCNRLPEFATPNGCASSWTRQEKSVTRKTIMGENIIVVPGKSISQTCLAHLHEQSQQKKHLFFENKINGLKKTGC